jgi:iron complex transport system substrate-binding protein
MHIRQHCIVVAVMAIAAAMSSSRAVEATEHPPRIVSLSPHITELLFAAGAGGRIVGVDDASDYPPAAARIDRLGEVDQLDIERLLKMNPTLVIVWGSGTPPRSNAELERLHLHLYVTEQRRLDDIGTTLIDFGRLAGTLPIAAEAAREFQVELAQLRDRFAGRPRLKVFYQVWDRPLYTLSGAHVVSEVLSLCGGDNIFADLSTLAPAVDKEAVLSSDPDVILIGAAGEDGARQARDWNKYASLRAVQRHHVFNVDPSLIGRMAPRILLGIRQVCSFLDQSRLDRAGTG